VRPTVPSSKTCRFHLSPRKGPSTRESATEQGIRPIGPEVVSPNTHALSIAWGTAIHLVRLVSESVSYGLVLVSAFVRPRPKFLPIRRHKGGGEHGSVRKGGGCASPDSNTYSERSEVTHDMPRESLLLLIATLPMLAAASCAAAEPVRLHSQNPHYFLFRGKPTILITSAEHYGAVLNLDFDYVKYLDALAADGLNNTRTFVGSYVEPQGAFKITRNTLAPAPGRFISPWTRSDTPGYANGGNKFDLSRWDEAYFARLRDFVAKASERDVVVEVNLFCPFYGEQQWRLSPMNAINNVNGIGQTERDEAYTVDKHPDLLEVQEAMTRKVVSELNEFDNVYFEIMNEPYARDVPLDWQHRIAEVIVETEHGLPRKHLISRNVANRKAQVQDPHAAVSILNFHYASPPDTVAMNYGLNRAIGDNETGFKGTGETHYRMEGGEVILAGGALYNNLDYSFAVGYEDGTFEYPATQPGSGSVALRRQLRVLSEFIHGFDFLSMAPHEGVLEGGLPGGLAGRALAEAGKQYAIYLRRTSAEAPAETVEVGLQLPAGTYRVKWVSVLTGDEEKSEEFRHEGGRKALQSPAFERDVALAVVAAGE